MIKFPESHFENGYPELHKRIAEQLINSKSELGEELYALSDTGNYLNAKNQLAKAFNITFKEGTLERFLDQGPKAFGSIGTLDLSYSKHNIPSYFNGLNYKEYDGMKLYLANVPRMFACQDGFIYIGVHAANYESEVTDAWVYVPLNVIRWDEDNVYAIALKYCGCMGINPNVINMDPAHFAMRGYGMTLYSPELYVKNIMFAIDTMFFDTDLVTGNDPDIYSVDHFYMKYPIWSLPHIVIVPNTKESTRSYKLPEAVMQSFYRMNRLKYFIDKISNLNGLNLDEDRIELLLTVTKEIDKELHNLRNGIVDIVLKWFDGTTLGIAKILYECAGLVARKQTSFFSIFHNFPSTLLRLENQRSYAIIDLFVSARTNSIGMYKWLLGNNTQYITFDNLNNRTKALIADLSDGIYGVSKITEYLSDLYDLYDHALPPIYSTSDFLFWLHKAYKNIFVIDHKLRRISGDVNSKVHFAMAIRGIPEFVRPFIDTVRGITQLPREAFTYKPSLPYVNTKRYSNVKSIPRYSYQPDANLKIINLEASGEQRGRELTLAELGMYTNGLVKCKGKLNIREALKRDLKGG